MQFAAVDDFLRRFIAIVLENPVCPKSRFPTIKLVLGILDHQEYMGLTVNFRSSKRYYKDTRHANPPEKLLIFENTHEPIVTKETWELAQCALKSKKRTDTLGVANFLFG